ncbi:efflux RND transporter periplasmic adaptor subunit, partial [Aliagarivorans marinus]|uniref:efflux RND transporter periplasmic adaptor subunit n=1 Tax=Aliagarivorans marinus TaxID=561965 RepID=UPI0006843AEC
MSRLIIAAVSMSLGLAGGVWLSQHSGLSFEGAMASDSGEPEPLYWVAPMDPNYRRDAPGKSPMGMDLVPVYEEAGASREPGMVTIDASVENNLGVRLAEVQQGAFVLEVRATGSLSLDQDSRWQLNSRVSGWVEQLHVRAEGEWVEKGQALFSLYSPELVKAQDDLLNAKALGNQRMLNAARQRLRFLGVDEGFIKRLLTSGKLKEQVTYYAPDSGYVMRLGVAEGGFISPASELISAARLDQIWLIAELFESQAQQLALGHRAVMQVDSYPGQLWQGEVDYIYPQLDAQSRTLQVRVKFDNADQRLKPNMYAQLQLQADAGQSSLFIPREAVIYGGEFNRVVMRRGSGQYQSVRVELGRENANQVEVLGGLEMGDQVVTSAQFMLDSESSLTAEFSRIGPPDRWVEQAQLAGVVRAVKSHALTIDHQPVDQWSWPAMVMDFPVEPELISQALEPGRKLSFTVEKQGNDYRIVGLTPLGMSPLKGGQHGHNHGDMNHADMDHSSMDHSSMNHGDMDHSSMDHSSMNHGEMDH